MLVNFNTPARIGFLGSDGTMFLTGAEVAPPLPTVPVESVLTRLTLAIRISL